MIKANDKWFRFLIILFPLMLSVYTNGLLGQPVTLVKLSKTLVSVTCIVLICEVNRFIISDSRRWRLSKRSPAHRNWLTIGLGLLFTMFTLAGSTLLRKYISTGKWDIGSTIISSVYVNGRPLGIGLFIYSFLDALIIFFFLFVMYEVLYHYAKLQHTEKQRELLEKEKLKAELHQLKGIINPHFLFNNLNSLSSLISENPARAEFFLDELTKVFRYLLRNNDTELTTLGNELQFIQSYYHLLQIRYGDAINMQVEVEKEYESLMIPPLTLQLLVENAVKHNRLDKEGPLAIELISAPGKKLVVRNNLAKKEGVIESTGIGLQNINARYKMLNRQGVLIEKTEQDFCVIITLIH